MLRRSNREFQFAFAGLIFGIILPAAVCAADQAQPADILASAGYEEHPTASALEFPDGDTLRLNDGQTADLAVIDTPKADFDEPERNTLARQAESELRRLTEGQPLRLFVRVPARNRYGHLHAHLVTQSGVWIQAALLERGLARVTKLWEDRDILASLLRIEDKARRAGRGIWRTRRYGVRTVENAQFNLDRFQIVEGTPRRIAQSNDAVFLDFGADWKTDFSLHIPNRVADSEFSGPTELETLVGRRLRMRGVVVWRYGPQLRIKHAAQIEIIAD